MIQKVTPTDKSHWLEMRKNNINSTEISAIFGANQYLTLYELWHRKKNSLDSSVEENEFMKWGNRLQDSIAMGIAADNGFEVRKMDEYIYDTDLRIGSSFDFAIGNEGILEIKNISERAFDRGWIVDGGNVEAPAHIEAQVQHQLLLSGRKFAYIGALVGGNSVTLIRREPDLEIHEAIKKGAKDFWDSITANREPTPDFEKDATFISKLYSFANPGTIKNASGDVRLNLLIEQYKETGEVIKAFQDKKDAIKAEILLAMGENEKMKGDGWSVSATMVAPATVSYERKGYRGFTVTTKKEKK